ncbi:hypothetical protein CHCC20487_3095 [Bacillus licheniformis]|nr:hypothetical protein CHCC20487_3095 [Bacillus licheniformis]
MPLLSPSLLFHVKQKMHRKNIWNQVCENENNNKKRRDDDGN